MKTDPRILVATEGVEEAALVRKLLHGEFGNVFASTDPELAVQDFTKHNPHVLILAFNTLEKAERYYLGLHRKTNLVQSSHRSIVLCNKDDVQQLYELCKQEYFDDYVLFWPMTHDTFRLPMAVHHAVRAMASSAGVESPTAGEFAALARRMPKLEPLEQSLARGGERIGVTAQAMERAEAGIGMALDNFYQRIAKGDRPELVEVRDRAKLREEFDSLKAGEIDKHFKAAGTAMQSVHEWAGTLNAAIAPRLDSERELQALATRVRPVVLFVDDDDFQHKLMGKILESANLTLMSARSGTETRATLRRYRPDLIIMDVGLPDVDGVETTRRIKSIEHLARIPVVMVTGQSEKDVLVDALKAGASDFVVKPFNAETMLSKVNKLLNVRAAT